MALETPILNPQSARLVEHLRGAVASGKLTAGARLPSMRELAQRFNVTIRTVQSAVRELESAGIVRSIHGSGIYVRDASDNAASSVATGRDGTRDSAVYVFDLKHLAAQDILSGQLTERLQQARLIPIRACIGDGGADSLSYLLDGWDQRPPRGVVLIGGNHEFMARLGQVLPADYPVIAAYAYPPSVGRAWHYVNPDERLGYYQAMEHLIRQGYRRIGMLLQRRDYPRSLFNQAQVRQGHAHLVGAAEAIKASGVPVRLSGRYVALTYSQQFAPSYAPAVQQEVENIVRWLARPARPEAIISQSWRLRFLRMACQRLGLQIGRDLAVLAIGDPTPAYRGECDCIAERYDLVASTVVDLLHDSADATRGPARHVLIPPRFISCQDFADSGGADAKQDGG